MTVAKIKKSTYSESAMTTIATTTEFRALLARGAIQEAEDQFREAKTAMIELKAENAFLRRSLVDAENAMQLRNTLHLVGGLLWAKSADGAKEGPFCPACLQKNHLRRLEQTFQDAGPGGWWCEGCGMQLQQE
jgi:hypothetical protein